MCARKETRTEPQTNNNNNNNNINNIRVIFYTPVDRFPTFHGEPPPPATDRDGVCDDRRLCGSPIDVRGVGPLDNIARTTCTHIDNVIIYYSPEQ